MHRLGACEAHACKTCATLTCVHKHHCTYIVQPNHITKHQAACACAPSFAKQSTHTHTWLSSESPPRTNQLNTHRNQTPDFTPAFAPREVQGGADAELWLSLPLVAWEPNGQFKIVHLELSISLLIVSVSSDMDTSICSNTIIMMYMIRVNVGTDISKH